MASSLPIAALFLTIAAATPAQGLYVFGDSLSYTGRLYAVIGAPGQPYVAGRYSDGPVYAEQLARATGRTLHDFAIPGATTADVLVTQVMPLLAGSPTGLPSDGLYVYWAGANDLFELLSAPAGNPVQVITNAMNETVTALVSLISQGAQDIVVLNLPDLSLTPWVIGLNDPATTASVKALVTAYNQALDNTVWYLESLTAIDIKTVDAFGLINDIAAAPAPYMLHVVDQMRLRQNGEVWPRQRRFLFFDDVHPTFGGHRAVMWTVMRELGQAVPGDVDGDFFVNIADLTAMAAVYGPCSASCAADLNGDLVVDSRDRVLLVGMLGEH